MYLVPGGYLVLGGVLSPRGVSAGGSGWGCVCPGVGEVGGVSAQGVSAQGGVCPGVCLPGGVSAQGCLPRRGVCPGGWG